MSAPRSLPTRAEVLASLRDAVQSAGAVDLGGDWESATPCGSWTSLDVLGHLVAITRYYLRLTVAAEASTPLAELPRGAALAEMNAMDLAGLKESDAPSRAAALGGLIRDYERHVHSLPWDLPLGSWHGLGTLTIGEHAGIAIGEFHVHLWDLARSFAGDHVPSNPMSVLCGQTVVGRAILQGDPWTSVLRGYERDPGWRPRRRATGRAASSPEEP